MKKHVSSHILASLLGPLCSPDDEDWVEMTRIEPSDIEKLAELVRDRVVPHFNEFDQGSQEKIRDSLEFFLGTTDSGVERVFPAFHIPIEPPESAKCFFSIVWLELFGAPVPFDVDASRFVKDNSDEFVNSLRIKGGTAH